MSTSKLVQLLLEFPYFLPSVSGEQWSEEGRVYRRNGIRKSEVVAGMVRKRSNLSQQWHVSDRVCSNNIEKTECVAKIL